MSVNLNAADRSRLSAILDRLGSSFAGERDAAALAAMRFIRARNLTWADLICPALAPAAAERNPLLDWPTHWRRAARLCLHVGAEIGLSVRDRDFLRTIAGYSHQPTDRQLEWLRSIAERVLAAEAVP